MESEVKTHKRKSKHLVDPGDLVSEKSLQKSYQILGQVGKLSKILEECGLQGDRKLAVNGNISN